MSGCWALLLPPPLFSVSIYLIPGQHGQLMPNGIFPSTSQNILNIPKYPQVLQVLESHLDAQGPKIFYFPDLTCFFCSKNCCQCFCSRVTHLKVTLSQYLQFLVSFSTPRINLSDIWHRTQFLVKPIVFLW